VAHEHAHHHHGATADADRGWLLVALAINVGFALAEVVVGLIADSVALLSDAAHMVTDAGAIGLALVALRFAARPAAGNYTFGWARSEILSAQANGAVMLVLATLLAWASVGRLGDPPDVDGGFVLAIGLAGAAVNGAAAWALSRANRASLNIEGAFLHNLMDLYSSLAAAAAGALILAAGWNVADPIAALTVCALMLYAAWGLLRDSGRIFLEAAPKGIDVEAVGNAMAAMANVVEVHDLHVWEVSSGFPALAAHVVVRADCDCHACRHELAVMLARDFGIEHTTLQVEHDAGLVQVQPRPLGRVVGDQPGAHRLGALGGLVVALARRDDRAEHQHVP
jgi:cobalt-zinc-cadmium efflux system protein